MPTPARAAATTSLSTALPSGSNLTAAQLRTAVGSIYDFAEAVVPAQTVYLSRALGTTGDADISFGSSTFGTDRTAAIQAVLNLGQNAPLTVYWDGRYSVTGLILYPNTTIISGLGYGAILRDNSNKAIFANANQQLGQDANGKPKISDSGVELWGGYWNCNGFRGGTPRQVHSTDSYGFTVGFAFYGVRDFAIHGAKLVNTRTYGVLFFTSEDIVVTDFEIYQGPTPQENQDGLDFGGYANNIKVDGYKARCGDDCLAFNTGLLYNNFDAGIYTRYIGLSGPQTNIKVSRVQLNGSYYGITLRSGTSRIDNAQFTDISGEVQAYWGLIDNYLQNPAGFDPPGPGNVGTIKFSNVQVKTTGPVPGFVNYAQASINCNCENIIFENVRRVNFELDKQPTILVKGTNTVVGNLTVRDYFSYDTGSNNAVPHVRVEQATVGNLNVSGTLQRASLNAATFVQVVNGGIVQHLDCERVVLSNLDNLLDNQATVSTITSLLTRQTGGSATFRSANVVSDIYAAAYSGPALLNDVAKFPNQRGDAFTGAGGVTDADPQLYTFVAGQGVAPDASSWSSGIGTLVFTQNTAAKRATFGVNGATVNGGQVYQSNAPALTGLSRMAYIWKGNLTSNNAYEILWYQDQNTPGGVEVYWDVVGAMLYMQFCTAAGGGDGNGTGKRSHKVPFSGGALQLYLGIDIGNTAKPFELIANGVTGTNLDGQTGTPTTFSNNPFLLFADSLTPTNAMIGNLERFKIFSRTLNATERANYLS